MDLGMAASDSHNSDGPGFRGFGKKVAIAEGGATQE
jgi:hypothetical protein